MKKQVLLGSLLIAIILLVGGCSDSDLEREKKQLQLETRLKTLTIENTKLQKELKSLSNENKNLNVSLAKSELIFTQKHRAELEREIKKLNNEREILRQEKINFKKRAYEEAESYVKSKYLWIIGLMPFIMLIGLVFFFVGMKKKKEEIKKLTEKIEKLKEEIKKLKEEKENLSKEREEYKRKVDEFSKIIEDLERKHQEGAINQVVNEIKMADTRRKELLEHLRGE